MRRALPNPLPENVEVTDDVATFTFPNPSNPEKPFVCRVNVSDGMMELIPERSANHRRIIASL